MISTFFKLAITLFALALSTHPAMAGGEAPKPKNNEAKMADIKGDLTAARQGWELIGNGALLIDVRSANEYQSGHIEGSLNIPHQEIEALENAIGPEKDRQIVLYCRSGRRAGKALSALEKQGYRNIFNASGLEALQVTKP